MHALGASVDIVPVNGEKSMAVLHYVNEGGDKQKDSHHIWLEISPIVNLSTGDHHIYLEITYGPVVSLNLL